ncbi:jg4997 [Pararge aegeria aegeria]|uniref:Jg4997 protein n=1 Tax=Pararge aegeria aegeria TaxID=348720 RepID=A0A8S4QT50_9NEOP|nr:jg4997 [Pararge aegeria aegeria]
MIVRVWCETGAGWSPTPVPVTPHTTSRDVLDCCRDPGDEPCLLLSVHPHHGATSSTALILLHNPEDQITTDNDIRSRNLPGYTIILGKASPREKTKSPTSDISRTWAPHHVLGGMRTILVMYTVYECS